MLVLVVEEMLQAVIRKCEEHGYYPDPTTVVTDFEKASMGAVSTSIGDQVSIQGCFYHLTQSTWRKVQELGLTNLYKESPEVRTFIGMIDALAFLPVDEVEQGMAHLKDVIPDHPGMEELLNYFDSTYVTGTFRRVNNNDPDAPIRVINHNVVTLN